MHKTITKLRTIILALKSIVIKAFSRTDMWLSEKYTWKDYQKEIVIIATLQTAPGNWTFTTGSNLGKSPEHQKRHKISLKISCAFFWHSGDFTSFGPVANVQFPGAVWDFYRITILLFAIQKPTRCVRLTCCWGVSSSNVRQSSQALYPLQPHLHKHRHVSYLLSCLRECTLIDNGEGSGKRDGEIFYTPSPCPFSHVLSMEIWK